MRLTLFAGPVELRVRKVRGTSNLFIALTDGVVAQKDRLPDSKGRPRPPEDYQVQAGTVLIPRRNGGSRPHYARYPLGILSAIDGCLHIQNLGECYPDERRELALCTDTVLDAVHYLALWRTLKDEERKHVRRLLLELGVAFDGDVDPFKVLARERAKYAATLQANGRVNIGASAARLQGVKGDIAKRLGVIANIDPRITRRLLALVEEKNQRRQDLRYAWKSLRVLASAAYLKQPPEATPDDWCVARKLLDETLTILARLDVEPFLSTRDHTSADLYHARRDIAQGRLPRARKLIDKSARALRFGAALVELAEIRTDASLAIAGKRLASECQNIVGRLDVFDKKARTLLNDEGFVSPTLRVTLERVTAAGLMFKQSDTATAEAEALDCLTVAVSRF